MKQLTSSSYQDTPEMVKLLSTTSLPSKISALVLLELKNVFFRHQGTVNYYPTQDALYESSKRAIRSLLRIFLM